MESQHTYAKLMSLKQIVMGHKHFGNVLGEAKSIIESPILTWHMRLPLFWQEDVHENLNDVLSDQHLMQSQHW